jgi:hypothetical protein
MYHLDELDSVLAFQALVGERRHGQFDHDAHRATGTSGARSKKTFVAKRATCAPSDVTAFIKTKRDERTGAIIRE